MRNEILTDALLREFLLGKLDDAERARIEGLFLTDSQARERVLIAEEDLIEDYLEDSLTAADRESFLLRYGQTPAQQRQLRISKSIKDWALSESVQTHAVPLKISAWSHLRERLRLRLAFVIPIAAVAVIAIVVAVVWFSGRRGQQRIEQELAQLNTPASLREVLPNTSVLVLSPVAVRGGEQEREVKKTADTRFVELRLPWLQNERYSSYRAEVRRVGGDELATIPNVPAENDGGYRIRVRLPAHQLNRGHYVVQLTGITSDGSAGLTENYTFAVSE